MQKKQLFFFYFFLVLAVFWAPYARGATVRVGLFPLDPLNFRDQNGNAAGFYTDLIKESFADKDLTPVFIYGSWAECLDRLQSEEIDLMTTIANTPDRAETMDFSKEAVALIWGQVFRRPEGEFGSILDLNGKTVAIMKKDLSGANFLKNLQSFGGTCQILELPSHDDVFEAVKSGKALAGVAPQHFGLRNCGNYGLVGTSIQFSPFPVFFATKKGKNNDLLNLLDEKIGGWKHDANSYYFSQLAFWFGQKSTGKGEIPLWIFGLLLLILIVALVSLWGNRLLKRLVREKTNALMAQEREFRQLVESVNSIILRLDSHKRITFINQYGLQLLGFTAKELLGKSVFETILPDKQNDGSDLLKMAEGVFENPEKFRLVENENQCKDGRRIMVQWSNRANYWDNGDFKEVLCVGTDISLRKSLEKDLLQAQKMEAIGRLAGGIAHDFNNILFIIMGNQDLALANLHDSSAVSYHLAQIKLGADRAKDLVKQILAFSRREGSEKHFLMLSAEIKDAVKMIRSTFPSTIKIVEDYSTDKFVLADPGQINQVFMNLCTNSMHALNGEPGVLKISVKEERLTNEIAFPRESNNYQEMLKVEISDTGMGIPPEIIGKIFEPFFSTKEKDKGSGMGLAVVHGIVAEHGGKIRVSSEVGKGSSFEVFFPIAQASNSADIAPEIKPKDLFGSERIMLVDDEKSLVAVNAAILKAKGYLVTGFNDPLEALKAFETNPDNYDLIVTDMTMPGFTGAKLAQSIFSLSPGFPIILLTGHSDLIDPEIARQMGFAAFAYKPLLAAELMTEIRRVLDSRKGRAD